MNEGGGGNPVETAVDSRLLIFSCVIAGLSGILGFFTQLSSGEET